MFLETKKGIIKRGLLKAEKGAPAPISGVVETVLKKLGLERRYKESQIPAFWEKWVGEAISQHTKPYRVVNKKLVVYVDSSVWLDQLNRYYKTWILKRVQTALGKELIGDIHFKVGEAPKEAEKGVKKEGKKGASKRD